MTKQTKQRASNNRTLTLTDAERKEFEQLLFVPKKGKKLQQAEIENKTIHANLFDVLDSMPKQVADLIIIDPPYNLTKNFNGFTFKATDSNDYIRYLQSWLPQVTAWLKPNGSLYLCGDWKNTAALQQVMEQHLTVINRITWQREKGRGAENNWKNGMEDIWFGVKDPKDYYFDVKAVKMKRRVIAPYRINGKPKDWDDTDDGKFRITYPSNFWDDISIPFWSMPENTDHPTQKPEKLIAKLVLASSPEGGVVIDPFLGSGTTSVVAKKLGRKYIGIEMNKEYVLWTEKRLRMCEQSSEIQGYRNHVFWERNTKIETKKTKNQQLILPKRCE